MKKNVLRALFMILLIAIIALYIFDIVVNQTPFTKNLFRTVSIAFVCLMGFYRINYSAGRRSLQFYESHFADAIRNAFVGQYLNRNKLLCAVRLFDEGNYRKAVKYLGQLQKECRTQDDYYAVWLFIALCFTRSEMYPEALKMYRQMVNNNLADSRIFSNMGFVNSEMGEFETAMSCYREALYLDKNNANTHLNIASIYFEQHEFDEAITWAQKALEIQPKMHQASALLAIIYALLCDQENTEKYFHIAISSGRNPNELKETIEHFRTTLKVMDEENNTEKEDEAL